MTEELIQGTDDWLNARLGHVTASNMSAIMAKVKSGEAATRKNYKMKLIAERLTGCVSETFKSSAMEHGTINEPSARARYELENCVIVDEIGFIKSSDIEWLGCSPDGLIGTDGLIEIKCPNTATHIDYIFSGKVPSDYLKQIQCQLWVTGRKWCDFVSYDPRLPEKNQLFIKRVTRDDAFINTMKEEVLLFLKEIEGIINKLSEVKNV